jgi:preprotein translocase subunit SecG
MEVFTAILVVVHLLVSAALVFLILLHSGKGGGMSDMFGGGMQSGSMGGATLAERNLDRLTVFVALAFALTTILLTLFIGQ